MSKPAKEPDTAGDPALLASLRCGVDRGGRPDYLNRARLVLANACAMVELECAAQRRRMFAPTQLWCDIPRSRR